MLFFIDVKKLSAEFDYCPPAIFKSRGYDGRRLTFDGHCIPSKESNWRKIPFAEDNTSWYVVLHPADEMTSDDDAPGQAFWYGDLDGGKFTVMCVLAFLPRKLWEEVWVRARYPRAGCRIQIQVEPKTEVEHKEYDMAWVGIPRVTFY